MPDKDELVRSVKLRIGSKKTLIRDPFVQSQKLFCLLEMKMYDSPMETHRTKFGCQNGTRHFEGSQVKVPRQLTLLKPSVDIIKIIKL